MTPDRQRLSGAGGRASVAFAAALSVEVALAVIDIALLPPNVLVTIGVLLPLLCALYSRPRDVAIVGLVAIVLVLASAAWRGDFRAAPYLQRVFIVAGGAILATMAAAGRARTARDRERFAALAAVAEIADGARSLQGTVAALNDLLVPAIADVCVIDAVSQGQLQRLAVRVGGRDGDTIASRLTARPPARTANDRPADATPLLAEQISDELLTAISDDPDDLRRLRGLHPTSAIVVPLRARGRSLGALTLLLTTRSQQRYGNEDLGFAKVLAGRAALALDNAGLFSGSSPKWSRMPCTTVSRHCIIRGASGARAGGPTHRGLRSGPRLRGAAHAAPRTPRRARRAAAADWCCWSA